MHPQASVLTSISGVGHRSGPVALRKVTDCCRGSGGLLREVGVEGRDAAGEAGLYLLAEAVSDDLVFASTAPRTLSPPAP
jgi:hypothetical protein